MQYKPGKTLCIDYSVIVAKRKASGRSVESIADAAGIVAATAYKIERGESNVTVRTLFKYCSTLGVSKARILCYR